MKIGLKFRCHSTRQGICPIRELNDDNILNVESGTNAVRDYGDNDDMCNNTMLKYQSVNDDTYNNIVPKYQINSNNETINLS